MDILFDDAATIVAAMQDSLQKFERSRLLEGLQRYLSGQVSLADMLFALDSFKLTFAADPAKVDRARNDYLCDFLFEEIRSSGYRSPIDFKTFERRGVSKELAAPAIAELSRKGFLVKNDNGEYDSTIQIWQDEIQKFREKVLRIDSELGQMVSEKSRDYKKIGWNYQSLLAKIPAITDSLIRFNETKIAEALKKRVFVENSHFEKHHAGRWAQEMISQFQVFFRESLGRLSPELRVESWPT